MKKIVLAIILLLGANCILAVSFAPDISLQNIPRIEDNNIDLYKIKNPLIKGLTKSYFAQDFKVTVTKELEYDDNRIKLTFKYKNIEEIYPPVYIPFEQYVSNMFTSKFKEKKDEIRIAKLQEEGRDSGTGLIKDIVIKLPKMAVPKVFRKLMGNQAAKLSLDGSQRLTIGGDKTTRINMGDNEKTGSKFPQFAMRQELNLRLKGTIGKKIHISVDHQSGSENDIVQPTEVNISYRGDDDEIVKTIEGGNIALALSGSHYINYSVSSEGLFGVKSDMEIGNLKLTAIMGKDQAKKNKQKITGGSEQDSTKVESKNYVQRTQYFIEDPAVIYELYSSEDPDAGSVPPGWLDNAIRTDGYGRWILSQIGADLLPKEGTEVFLYLDDQNPDNNSTAVPGYGIGESSHPDSASYQFDILREPEDFYINNAGIISLNRSIDKSYIIGITYTRNDGMEVGNASPEIPGDPIEVKIIKQRNQTSDAFPEIWKMQVKNIYNLSPNIQNEGFDIKIFKEFNGVPNYNLPTNVDVTNPDPFGEEFKTFNDYLRLNTNGDDLINNDDETIDLVYGNIIFPFLEPFASFGVVVGDEDIYTGSTPDVTDIFLYVKGKVGRDKIPLQGMDILPGSVKVKINGAAAKENVDYIVDYDMGELVLLSPIAKDPNADIDIDFQSRPLFGIESKTLLGARADLTFNEHAKLGGTIIYQSEKVSEERPKIGSENRSILMADIDGEVGTELPFITTAIDFLPLINTDEPSSVSLSGEVAMSLPRIWGNPKQSDVKEAYIDDMESIVNTYPLGVTRTSWVPASRPLDTDFGKATPNWYNPQNIYGRDVYDPETLTAKEQREKVTLLECRLTPPTITNPHIENKYWGGLMKYVGNQVDFSKKKYIEVNLLMVCFIIIKKKWIKLLRLVI